MTPMVARETEATPTGCASTAPPMRVTYLVNQYPKASHTFIRREIAALEAAGFAVERWSIRRTPEPLVDEADRLEARLTQVIFDAGPLGFLGALLRCGLGRPLRTARALAATLRLSRAARGGLVRHLAYLAEACVLLPHVRRSGSEHVHAHFGTNSTTVALLLRELGGPPFSFTAHGTESFEDPLGIGLPFKVRRASFVVAVSEYGRSELARLCSQESLARLEVVRCGVDAAFLAEPIETPPAGGRLVCVGRLSPEKGHRVLLEALGRLAAEGLAFELDLVGDGELRPELEALAQRLGIPSRVRFLGWLDSAGVRAEIRAARALVLPSLAEGLPVVLMEALGLGRPAVASAVGGIPELIEDGRTGWLVPPGSERHLAEALRAVLSATVEELATLGQAGAERVARRHDAHTEALVLARLFRRSTESRGA